jgi:hypothetical protein
MLVKSARNVALPSVPLLPKLSVGDEFSHRQTHPYRASLLGLSLAISVCPRYLQQATQVFGRVSGRNPTVANTSFG